MRRYTFPSTILIFVLAGSLATGIESGRQARRKPATKPAPGALTSPDDWPPRVVDIDATTIEVQGRRFKVKDWSACPNLMKPEPPFPFYRIDPKDGDRNNPLPGGAADVRAVLEREKPVPRDRTAFFAALDRDPRSDQYPRGGWYVYVTKVDRQPDGSWTAEVMAGVWFDHNRNVNGGLPMGQCWQKWIERYHWDGFTLTYLGGHPSRPGELPEILESN